MSKFLFVAVLSTAICFTAQAQFNPDVAEKSLVKVLVTGGDKMGVCSGFVWKKKSWIVTSLHAMKPGGKVQVVYSGDNIREAKVIKVYVPADLVLLETNIDANPVANEVIPLVNYHLGSVAFAEKIYAIGYNGGSKGDQTQALEKGHANPETLEFLVRPQDKSQLSALGFPSMKLPIYFLSGSLLPGFSGSPVYNTKNELIGIGDGGLERGLMNVSWCIPASNLDALESSSVATLPANLGNAAQLYSAEVVIDVQKGNEGNTGSPSEPEALADNYKSYQYGEYNFFYTKTRTFEQMHRSAVDPENMESFASDFSEGNVHIDYDVLNFDIYQEIDNGFMLALPEGTDLTYDSEYGLFSVDLTNFPDGNYFDLFYYMVENNGDPVQEVIDEISEGFKNDVKGLTPDARYTKSQVINSEWREDYRLLTGNETYDEPGLGTVSATFYLNVISNDKVAFYSLAVCYLPVERKDIQEAVETGIDCINNYDENAESCDYFESLMQIIASVHLTTVASLY